MIVSVAIVRNKVARIKSTQSLSPSDVNTKMSRRSNAKNSFALVAALTGTAAVVWAFSGRPSRREPVQLPEVAAEVGSTRKLEDLIRRQLPVVEQPPAAFPLSAPFEEAEANAAQDAWARSLGKSSRVEKNSIGMELVLIPPGKFIMGSPPSEKDRHEDENQFEVTLTKPFYLAKTEVTQGQWRAVMGTTPWMDQSDLREGDDYPATNVSWHDARAFCKKLSEKEKKYEYRLPSEAEWEYACRAGTTTRFSFGDDEDSLSGFAWYYTNAGIFYLGYAHEVGQLEKNSFGLRDMHGNVREWCEDVYVNNLPGGIDPLVSEGGLSRVFRGGGWATRGASCRSASRDSFVPTYRDCFVGFRVVRSVAEAPAPPSQQLAPAEVQKNLVEMDLILIPGGTFRMGNPADAQVEVTLTRAFYLGKTEVTQGQWRAVMGTTPWKRKDHVWEGDNYPATYVSWDDARAFCQKLSAMEGEVYRLPTEAEWEYVCRGGTTTRFHFGDDEASLSDYAWWGGLYGEGNAKDERYAHEVGQKKANPVGLFDMHGNVFEWCEDRFTDRLPGGTDPLVLAGGWYRVNRGGSWYRRAVNCGSASRGDSRSRSQRSHDLGFRVARSYGL